ncbi:hypothetical protein SLE2022_035920 [Rubroshorea leprosula]
MVDVENLEFKWGKKRGVGGKKRDVQFYESFTYDGEEYRLYDCVYFFKDDEPLPYIGKIIKIWENPDKTKKVKVVWFFQPLEISCYLAAGEALENELVLATGEGSGLTNINPLEAIAGKCNVVCISKDSRNRQPSIEERQLADYVFYQTFDVGQCTISDKIDEKIAGIEAKYFFNREGFLKPSADQKSGGAGKEDTPGKQIPEQPDGDMKDSLSVIHDKVAPVVQEVGGEIAGTDKKDSLSGLKSSSKIDSDVREGNVGKVVVDKVKVDGKLNSSRDSGDLDDRAHKKAKIDDSVKVPDEAKKIYVQNFSRHDSDSDAAKANVVQEVGGEIAGTDKKDSLSGLKSSSKIDSDVREGNVGKVVVDKVKVDGKLNSSRDSGDLDDRAHKKAKIDDSVKVPDEAKKINVQNFSRHDSDSDAAKANVVQEVGGEIAGTDKKDSLSGLKSSSKIDSDVREGNVGKVVVDKVKVDGKLNSSRDSGDLDDRAHKKAKIDDSVKVPDEAKKINVQNFSRHDSDSNAAKALEPNVKASEDKSKLSKDSHGKVKSFLKELKTDDKLTKLGNGKLPKESSVQPPKDYKKSKSKKHALQSMGKLDFDRSKWFKELPWEERMKNAHEEETLVLLQNLDPAYTSADVQDIVRQVFKETCTAKMFQRTAFSNPYYGQAFVIFKTREVAQMVVTRLDKGCLLLPNGRPLVASIANPSFPKKQSTFAGHLTLDKLKLQTQREMKEAVSTSHCSQQNTLEFDMAMEWCLLQERAECSWKKLFELQEKEYRRVKAELKSK